MNIPNTLSFLRIFLTPLFVIFIFSNHIILSLAAFLIASITDFWDGFIARKYKTFTKLGAFLDPLADKVLVISALTSFWMLGIIQGIIVFIIIFRDLIITFLRKFLQNSSRPMITSKIAKLKTVSQFVLIYFVLFYLLVSEKDSIFYSPNLINLIVRYNLILVVSWIAVTLTLYSGIWYLWLNRHIFK